MIDTWHTWALYHLPVCINQSAHDGHGTVYVRHTLLHLPQPAMSIGQDGNSSTHVTRNTPAML